MAPPERLGNAAPGTPSRPSRQPSSALASSATDSQPDPAARSLPQPEPDSPTHASGFPAAGMALLMSGRIATAVRQCSQAGARSAAAARWGARALPAAAAAPSLVRPGQLQAVRASRSVCCWGTAGIRAVSASANQFRASVARAACRHPAACRSLLATMLAVSTLRPPQPTAPAAAWTTTSAAR